MIVCTLVATAITVLIVVIHFYSLRKLRALMPAQEDHNHFLRSVFILICLVGVHLLEVLIFTGSLFLTDSHGGGLFFKPVLSNGFLDYFYTSLISYSTLGLSESVPIGAMKILIGIESLIGFIMITWSASFFYSIVENDSCCESKSTSLFE